MRLLPSTRFGNAVMHFVTKLVRSFGLGSDTAESLDDFRYTLRRSGEKKI